MANPMATKNDSAGRLLFVDLDCDDVSHVNLCLDISGCWQQPFLRRAGSVGEQIPGGVLGSSFRGED